MKLPQHNTMLYAALQFLAESGPMTAHKAAGYAVLLPILRENRLVRIERVLNDLIGYGCVTCDRAGVYRVIQRVQDYFDGTEPDHGTDPAAPVTPPRRALPFRPISPQFLPPVLGTRPGSNDHRAIPSLHQRSHAC